jgi:tetratricopeptide (TPR) repeat protein
MYLNNPRISGGNVPKAIETFESCSGALPEDDRCPVLLAMAWRKEGDPERARKAAREALRRNPESRDAKLLLGELGRLGERDRGGSNSLEASAPSSTR